jgi:predicted nucleic acid-binding protein
MATSLIAADTSSLIAFLTGADGDDVRRIEEAMRDELLVLPPPVVSELLSASASTRDAHSLLREVRLLPIESGFWERAGETRRRVLSQGLKAALADALIAQCCLDADVPLIVRDRDFRHFERLCGLTLV